MKDILLECMRTNSSVRKSLRLSGTLRLLYCVCDKYWGVGMKPRLVAVSNTYRGTNMLGTLWEEIRELFASEIEMKECNKCSACQQKRTDATFNREMEQYVCTQCLS